MYPIFPHEKRNWKSLLTKRNQVLTCLAAAVVLLSHFCGLQARIQTKTKEEIYNASSSTVNAIFLCLVIWAVSSLRAAYPQFTIPFLLATIFSMVGITFGPTLLAEHDSLVLVKQLLVSYLTGYALSTAVSFFWFPLTSRTVFLAGSKEFLGICETLLREERCFFGALMCKKGDQANKKKLLLTQFAKLKRLAMTMLSAMAKMREELGYARQEVALGVYSGEDLAGLLRCCEGLMIPILGLSKLEAFTGRSCDGTMDYAQKRMVKENFRVFEQALRGLSTMRRKMTVLAETNKLRRRDTSVDTLEKAGGTTIASEMAAKEVDLFVPDPCCSPRDAEFDEEIFAKPRGSNPEAQQAIQQQLYIQCLLDSTSQACVELADFSDHVLAVRTVRGSHLILPSMKSWSPSSPPLSSTLDPEHLPPATSSQKLGDTSRKLLSSLSSDASKFGLRVLFATMSIGVIAFLRPTQHFFIRYRLVWAMVMIPISMSPTSGTAIYGFIGRALGVAAAMVLTYVNWYVVDGKPAGVIVVFGLFMMGYYWLLMKWPRFVVLFVLAAVNHVLIIGEPISFPPQSSNKANYADGGDRI